MAATRRGGSLQEMCGSGARRGARVFGESFQCCARTATAPRYSVWLRAACSRRSRSRSANRARRSSTKACVLMCSKPGGLLRRSAARAGIVPFGSKKGSDRDVSTPSPRSSSGSVKNPGHSDALGTKPAEIAWAPASDQVGRAGKDLTRYRHLQEWSALRGHRCVESRDRQKSFRNWPTRIGFVRPLCRGTPHFMTLQRTAGAPSSLRTLLEFCTEVRGGPEHPLLSDLPSF